MDITCIHSHKVDKCPMWHCRYSELVEAHGYVKQSVSGYVRHPGMTRLLCISTFDDGFKVYQIEREIVPKEEFTEFVKNDVIFRGEM